MFEDTAHNATLKRRNGTIRSNRLSKDLLENPFQIDARDSWDILAYIVSYLGKIKYYNIKNISEGHWNALVEKDALMYMASIINKATDDIDSTIREYDAIKVQNEKGKYKGSEKERIINMLDHWWDKIHKWSTDLETCNEKELATKIKNSIVNGITYNRNYIVKDSDGKLDLSKLVTVAKESESIGFILGEILHDFQKAIVHIKKTTKNYFQENILENNHHLPHNAMYIAFTLLFEKLQSKLNGLSKKHLDYYYNDVLKQEKYKGNSARAIVNIELQPIIPKTFIPKGTKLSAGKILGSKTEILFETQKDLMAYQAELVNIQTLFINSNKYNDVGTDTPIISSISCNQLYRYSKDQVPRKDWFVFGANKKTVQNSKISAIITANIGFIIGSPVLFLSEGKREIKLRLNLENDTSKQAFWKLLTQIKNNREMAMSTAISKVFDKGFKICYTSKKGWIPCDYMIEFNELENYFTIRLLLDYADSSLELGESIKEELTWPSIKVELNEYAPVFAYSFFKAVEIDTITINVDVIGMKNLSFYNNIGKMPAGKPFDLFGPEPEKGDYFMVGHSELFKKQVNNLELELDWDRIPTDFGGFESYYNAYGETINNNTFKVQFSVLSNGYWYPSYSENNPVKNLFSTTKCLTPEGYESEQLESSRILEFDNFSELGIKSDNSLKDPLLYTVISQGGFIKMTFCSPDFGFASDMYWKEFTEIATYNAKNKRQIPYPNKPFVPKIKGASVSYKASDVLHFGKKLVTGRNSGLYHGEFKHITPFIVRDVIVNQIVKSKNLFPNFKQEGYLGLGLMGVKSKTEISIYFNFMRSSSTVDIKNNWLKWEYFSIPEWREFDKNAIIRDDTNGFLKSGIVQLILPNVEGKERGIHPDILWIRASTSGDIENYPKIKGIYLNAVDTICISNDPSVIGKRIVKESIHKTHKKFPDIKSVYQAGSTFAARIPEVGNDFYTRVSERLRHKGRAVTLWDYERLIMEKFDDVLIAKCTNFNAHFEVVPGHVKVIVFSKRWTQRAPYYFSKMKLKRMNDYLNKIASPFIDIEVINPVSEFLLVKCIVVFNEMNAGLNYRQKLTDDIIQILSPITNMDSNTGGIGGSVMPSTVANQVENLPYIKRLEKLNIEHIIRKGLNNFTLDVHKNEHIIYARTPWSILAPLRKHRIITEKDMKGSTIEEEMKVGINNLGVGIDFIVGEAHVH